MRLCATFFHTKIINCICIYPVYTSESGRVRGTRIQQHAVQTLRRPGRARGCHERGRVNADGSSAAMAISPPAVYSDIEINDDGSAVKTDGTKVYFHGTSTSAAATTPTAKLLGPPSRRLAVLKAPYSILDSQFLTDNCTLAEQPAVHFALSPASDCDNNAHWPEASYSILSSISSGCSGLPARSVAFQISPSGGADLCSNTHVRCDSGTPYAKVDGGTFHYG